MPIIVKLETSKHIKNRMLVFFDDESLLKISDMQVLQYDLFVGKNLSDSDYRTLENAAKLTSAKMSALNIINRKMVSSGELALKLQQKGENADCIKQTIEWLKDLNALDDYKYAVSIAQYYSSRGYGRKKIESEFFRRLIPRQFWNNAINEVDFDSNVSDKIDVLIEKKLKNVVPDDRALIKIQNYLLRRGFSWDEINNAIARNRGNQYE